MSWPSPLVDPLAPGDLFSLAIDGSFESVGNKSVSFKIDNANELNESNDDNNWISGTIAVTNSNTNFDLIIEDISISPVQPVVGQQTTIVVQGKYQGDVALISGQGINNVGFFSQDFKAYNESSPSPSVTNPLFSAQSFTYTYSGYFESGGNKSLSFKIDNANELSESNEVNNSFTKIVNVLSEGSLIKTSNSSSVYKIGSDGRRHLFVNSVTFWSHYTGSWSDLKYNGNSVALQEISQATLSSILIGSNITVKPGSRLIKFKTSPKIYAVFGGNKLKRIIDGTSIYGSDWMDKVIMIQNSFEGDYTVADSEFTDSDNDGISNSDEIDIYSTDPNNSDTDGDGYVDGLEIINGYNPNDLDNL